MVLLFRMQTMVINIAEHKIRLLFDLHSEAGKSHSTLVCRVIRLNVIDRDARSFGEL